ncbi:SRPBCC domain-containing protein [Rhizobium leguminosarum]|uniref:SRPBCC domain-containing protein n=1 Tax=Rhizobium leguminosarum TaxID=384 RepID=UPI001441C1E8|nr:SRPBCC domain-containing protein [Rhizobium leguminosarum]MBY5867473.1 ATPase [Rhizobium leguminosarum]NKM05296.1 ATPase [Rhizobium leguminosarum bv. viciae]
MHEFETMAFGALTESRRINADRGLVYDAWTLLEHRRQWFAGPEWTEIARSLDLRVGGHEVAHGRFPDGTETIYKARFHLIEPHKRLIYAFDMSVAGEPFSISLAGVEFSEDSGTTVLTYTEQAFFLAGDYDAESRRHGTNFLLEQFEVHVSRQS